MSSLARRVAAALDVRRKRRTRVGRCPVCRRIVYEDEPHTKAGRSVFHKPACDRYKSRNL